MRRLLVELPPSRAAVWCRRTALFALAVVAIAVLLSRLGRLETPAALAVLGSGLALAVAALVLAAAAFVVIWNDGRPGFAAAMGGVFAALMLIAWPGYLAAQALRLPRLSGVSTDLADPPGFSRSRKAMAARQDRLPPPLPASARALQQAAYPGIASLSVELTPAEAYALALKVAAQRGWTIVDAAAPGGRMDIGRIDAVDRTLLMGFPDDVTVRIKAAPEGTRIDVRSVSRYGSHDFGTNARRVQAYLDALSDLVDAQ